MKKLLFIGLILTVACLAITAQETQKAASEFDVIIKENGEEIANVKVIEITLTEIKYKRGSNLDGPTYTIAKSDVFMIKYPNGEKDVFEKEKPATTTPVQTTPVQTATPQQTTPVQTATPQQTTPVQTTTTAQTRQPQPAPGRTIREPKQLKKFQIGIAPAIGAGYSNAVEIAVALQATARLRFNMMDHLVWDLINITYGPNFYSGGYMEERVQFMTGYIWKSSDKTALILGMRAGYGIGSLLEADIFGESSYRETQRIQGFCLEVEAGVLIRNAFSIALVVNAQRGEDILVGSGEYSTYSPAQNAFFGLGFAFYF